MPTLSEAVVLDNGSGFLKAGVHTNAEPTVVIPQLIGRPRCLHVMRAKEIFIGRRASTMSGISKVSSATDRDAVDIDEQVLIFEEAFRRLNVESDEYPLLISQLPISFRHQAMRLTSEFFERFYVPSLAKKPDCVLDLMDVGRVTGTVVDCGDGVCHTSALYSGEILHNTAQLLRLGGKDVSDYMARVIARETGFRASSRSAFDHVTNLKERLQPYRDKGQDRFLKRASSLEYPLPDGQTIHVRAKSVPELYTSAEILFEPERLGIHTGGLTKMLCHSLSNAPSNLLPILSQNVAVCGGSSLLCGLNERLEKEISKTAGVELRFLASAKPQYSAWRGGAVFASLSTFSAASVTREMYFEEGPYRIERAFM